MHTIYYSCQQQGQHQSMAAAMGSCLDRMLPTMGAHVSNMNAVGRRLRLMKLLGSSFCCGGCSGQAIGDNQGCQLSY